MTKITALRAGTFFIVLTIAFAAIGLGSHAAIAEVMFLISGSLSALMLFFALATPDHATVPVRIRRLATHR